MATSKPERQRFFFPDAAFIPAIQKSGSESNKEEKISTVHDTYFFNLFRDWSNSSKLGYDTDLHAELRTVFKSYIERIVALQMVTGDIKNAASSLGMNMDFDKTRLDGIITSLVEALLFRDIANAIGLSGFADDIVIRELDKLFGMAPIMASEKRKAQQKQTDDTDFSKNALAGINNYLRDVVAKLGRLESTAETQARTYDKPLDPTGMLEAMRMRIMRETAKAPDVDDQGDQS